MSSMKLSATVPKGKGPIAFKSINVRRLAIRLWAWKVFCFIKRKRNDLHKKQVKIGTMLMFTKFSDGVAEDLLEKSNYATKMFDAVFGDQEIASLDWDGVVSRLRAFEDEEGLPNTVPFMTDFVPAALTVQVTAKGSKPADVELTSMSDPKATAAETIVHYDLPHEELDQIISTLQHELLPLVRGDVTSRRDMLVNFQRWLITMQNLASKYDDTQMKLLKQAQSDEPESDAPKIVTTAVKPSTNKLAASFYKQVVETKRQLEEVESQVDRLKEALGPVEEVASAPSPGAGKLSRLEMVAEAASAPAGGGRGRRASVSVKSMLDAAAAKTAVASKSKAAVFSVIEENEEEEENGTSGTKANKGNSFPHAELSPGVEVSKMKEESNRTRLYQKAENDKSSLISTNMGLREMLNNSTFEDIESRKIISELKMWEQERDTLEAQIEQHEDYINSLRSRISNYQSGKGDRTVRI
jgi:hypothetical protein